MPSKYGVRTRRPKPDEIHSPKRMTSSTLSQTR